MECPHANKTIHDVAPDPLKAWAGTPLKLTTWAWSGRAQRPARAPALPVRARECIGNAHAHSHTCPVTPHKHTQHARTHQRTHAHPHLHHARTPTHRPTHASTHTHTEKPTAAGPRNASGGMMLGDADAGMRGGCWPFAASLPLLPLGLMLPSANASDACFSS